MINIPALSAAVKENFSHFSSRKKTHNALQLAACGAPYARTSPWTRPLSNGRRLPCGCGNQSIFTGVSWKRKRKQWIYGFPQLQLPWSCQSYGAEVDATIRTDCLSESAWLINILCCWTTNTDTFCKLESRFCFVYCVFLQQITPVIWCFGQRLQTNLLIPFNPLRPGYAVPFLNLV